MSLYNKRILILGGSEFQIPLLLEAKKNCMYIGLIDWDKNAPARYLADEFFNVSLKNKEYVLNIAKKFNPNGITVGITDTAVPTCAYVAKKIGLPGISEKSSILSTNKYEMIRRFEQCDVPHPDYYYVDDEELKTSPVGYPAIVKPVDMAGSKGIIKVNDDRDLIEALQRSKKISDSGKIIIEEYLDGPEVSVELVITNKKVHVIQITDKTTTGPPHFIEVGHSQPSTLDDDSISDIKNVAIKAAQSLEIDNCLGHVEIKLTSNGAKMIEMGARAGGDSIGEQLILNSTGINFQDIALNLAIGNEIQISEPMYFTPCCIKFIQCKQGILRKIKEPKTIGQSDNIIEVKITGEIGKRYSDPIDNSGRWGYVIAKGETLEDAKSTCDRVIQEIVFETSSEIPP